MMFKLMSLLFTTLVLLGGCASASRPSFVQIASRVATYKAVMVQGPTCIAVEHIKIGGPIPFPWRAIEINEVEGGGPSYLPMSDETKALLVLNPETGKLKRLPVEEVTHELIAPQVTCKEVFLAMCKARMFAPNDCTEREKEFEEE